MQNQKNSSISPTQKPGLEEFLERMFEFLSGIDSYESPYANYTSLDDEDRLRIAKDLTNQSALRAGTISASFSLPGGPIGFLTLIPEVFMIFRIQGNLVKDIASLYGKEAQLTKELLMFSMFKHGGAHLFRKFIEETGVRVLIRPTTVRAFQGLLQKLGLTISRKILKKNLARWVPFAGAAITGSFAYFDTKTVGQNALDLFSKEISIVEGP